jgi:hypothetical protein
MPGKQRARSRSSSVVVTENPLLTLPRLELGDNSVRAAEVPAPGPSAAPLGDLLQLLEDAPPAVDDDLDLDAILSPVGPSGDVDLDELDALLDGGAANDELDALLGDATAASTAALAPEPSVAAPSGPDPRLATIRKAGEDVVNGASGQADRVAPARGPRSRGDAAPVRKRRFAMQGMDAIAAFAGKSAEASDLAHDGHAAFGIAELHRQAAGDEHVFSGNGSEHNIAEGVAGSVGAIATLRDAEASKTERAAAGLSLAGNVYKTASGVSTTLGEHPSGELAAHQDDLNAAGAAFGTFSDGLLGGAQALGVVTGLREAGRAARASHLGASEKATTVGGKVSGAVGSGASAVASGAKVAGAANGSLEVASTVAEASGVAAVAGIVTGALDLVQGALAIRDARRKAEALGQAQDALHEGLRAVTAERRSVLRQAEAFAATSDDAAVTDTSVAAAEALARVDLDRLDGFEAQLGEASAVVDSLIGIQGQARRDGAHKVVGGALGATGGALTLSGVGLPIVLSVGVAAALVKLGGVGAQWARDKKTNTWIELARGLTPDGAPKTPDPSEDIGYPGMEERFLAAYYKGDAPIDKTGKPPGALGHAVWQFGRAEKRHRLGKPTPANKRDMRTLSVSERRLYWLESDKGEEKSNGKHVWGDFFKSNVTASSQAKEVKRHEVVDALNHIAWNTFDESGPAFRTGSGVARVQISSADRDTYKMSDADFATLKSLTDDVILSTTGLKNKAPAYKAAKDARALAESPVRQPHMRDFVASFVR